eukprot:3754497-Rhodomonas_salina.1
MLPHYSEPPELVLPCGIFKYHGTGRGVASYWTSRSTICYASTPHRVAPYWADGTCNVHAPTRSVIPRPPMRLRVAPIPATCTCSAGSAPKS